MARQISTRQPNQITNTPATVQACTSDLRTPAQQTTANAAATNQAAQARMAASDTAAAKTWGRR